MLKELKDSFTPNCKFSGTSAGAIGAFFAAFGLDNFEEFTREMQRRYGNSAQDNQKWVPAYGWLRRQFAAWPSYYDLIGVLALFDQRLQEKISAFLAGIDDAMIDTTFPDDEGGRERMRLLREPYEASISREGKLLTFRDLELLQKLPNGRENFHDFAAAIWDKTDQKLIFAKKETYPHMPVVLALYASMSIPGAFKFLSIPLDKSDGKAHQLCDGGYGANSPIHAFTDADGPASDGGETVAAVFDAEGGGANTLHGHPETFPKYIRRVAKFFRISYSMEKYVKDEKKRLKQNSEKLLVLPHGDVGVLSFGFPEEKRAAIDYQVDLRVRAWKICKIRGANWPRSIWPTAKADSTM
jgi:predicted acylesterase/phospholipase RssA